MPSRSTISRSRNFRTERRNPASNDAGDRSRGARECEELRTFMAPNIGTMRRRGNEKRYPPTYSFGQGYAWIPPDMSGDARNKPARIGSLRRFTAILRKRGDRLIRFGLDLGRKRGALPRAAPRQRHRRTAPCAGGARHDAAWRPGPRGHGTAMDRWRELSRGYSIRRQPRQLGPDIARHGCVRLRGSGDSVRLHCIRHSEIVGYVGPSWPP